MTDLIKAYDKKNTRKIYPVFVTFQELTAAIYARIRATHPGFVVTWSIETRIHDLWMLGAPHPQMWERRLLLPNQLKQLAREIGQEIGAQVMRNTNA